MKALCLLAEGFEESEAVVPIDLLRRARVEVVTVSVTEEPLVLSSHGIPVTADTVLSKVEDTADALFLPGGLKGTNNLKASEAVAEFIRRHLEADRYMTAEEVPDRVLRLNYQLSCLLLNLTIVNLTIGYT